MLQLFRHHSIHIHIYARMPHKHINANVPFSPGNKIKRGKEGKKEKKSSGETAVYVINIDIRDIYFHIITEIQHFQVNAMKNTSVSNQ